MIVINIDLESSFCVIVGVRTSYCYTIDLHIIFQPITLRMLCILFLYIVENISLPLLNMENSRCREKPFEKQLSRKYGTSHITGVPQAKVIFHNMFIKTVFEISKFLLILFTFYSSNIQKVSIKSIAKF